MKNEKGQLSWMVFVLLGILVISCAEDTTDEHATQDVDEETRLDVPAAGPWTMTLVDDDGLGIVIHRDFTPETRLLQLAEEDILDNVLTVSGAAAHGERKGIHLILDESLESDLGIDGFQMTRFGDGTTGFIAIEAAGEKGVAYGLYQLSEWMGVAYIHPEETVWASRSEITLEWEEEVWISTPRFSLRGFHEHTQHPTVWSDYLLNPEVSGNQEAVSHYLRWLARNRQNQFTFHMLKTVELESWTPYMKEVISEAHELGIQTGAVIGFVDQQQNAYKMIGELPDLSEEEQLAQRVDAVLETGLDILGIQIGASEFVKPPDDDVRRWISLLMAHLADEWPSIRAYAWIHTPCDLEDEEGNLFFHLPLQLEDTFGAWVHTTMYYDMEHPAPVYGCENFRHQRKFIEEASGERELIYFPETAWWLGFDNNLPMFLPLTGWSRAYDIVNVLSEHPDVTGHLTFTTGREWSYWMFDHYLTRATWDDELTWANYLQSMGFVFGAEGDAWMELIDEWTMIQKRFFYDENPGLFFYVAGELPADEAGAKVDAGARPVRPSFQSIYDMTPEEFEAWTSTDFDGLVALEKELASMVSRMPTWQGDSQQEAFRVAELSAAMTLSLARVQQSLALYTAVFDIREGNLQNAEANLQVSRDLSEQAVAQVAIQEEGYRYPLELLAREKESLTSYPYGYLYETSTGYFWTRRDEQLAVFLENVMATQNESWSDEPGHVIQAGPEQITLTQPSDAVASSVIGAFMPTFLFALNEVDEGEITVKLAEDTNGNGLPDEGTEQSFFGELENGEWKGERDLLLVRLIDSAGVWITDLELEEVELTLAVQVEPFWSVGTGSLKAMVAAQLLVDTIASFDGIDAAGAEGLIGSIYGYEPGEPLPDLLPFSFTIESIEK